MIRTPHGGKLAILRDLMLGGRHSRRTVAAQAGCSLPTADRWLAEILGLIPGARTQRIGKTTWLYWVAPPARLRVAT